MILVGLLTGCAAVPAPATVDHVDLDKYSGKWYEIARIPHLYEYNAVAATQWYLPDKDGRMLVIHRCHQDTTFGFMREDVGFGTVVDKKSNAKMSVDMGLAGGDLWVLDLDKDYQYAMVGTPDRRSLWIYSRRPTLAPEVDERLFRLADDLWDTTPARFAGLRSRWGSETPFQQSDVKQERANHSVCPLSLSCSNRGLRLHAEKPMLRSTSA